MATEAEQYLVTQIRAGDQRAWSQLVERFQGRLMAFALSRRLRPTDAEDLVQDTFLQLLRSLPTYRHEAAMETWLFMILRRRMIDFHRTAKFYACLVQGGDEEDSSTGWASAPEPAAADPTASTYARRDEQLGDERRALSAALAELIESLKQQERFRDLQLAELLFYAQQRNRDIGRVLGIEEPAVALFKHRWLKQLRENVARRLGAPAEIPDGPAADSLLTEIWEAGRLSCPKRTTVGGFLLGTLEPGWHAYVDFHLNRLGCRFCQANLSDLKAQTDAAPKALHERIMQSTVGFLTK